MWKGQDYFLQIDAHMRFVRGWDATLIAMLSSLPGKALLSTYPADMKYHADYVSGKKLTSVPVMKGLKKDAREIYRPVAAAMAALPDAPVPGPSVAAGFFFCQARCLLEEVPFDPYLDDLFSGEEVLLSARLFTHGWDVFSPNVPLAFHKYVRPGEPRYWERQKNDEESVKRMKNILKLSAEAPAHLNRHLDRFGLGRERQLDDFWLKAIAS